MGSSFFFPPEQGAKDDWKTVYNGIDASCGCWGGGWSDIFWDRDSKTPRAGFALLPNESPSLELSDKEGNLRTVFGLGTDGEPVLGLFDQHGNLHTALGVETCEKPDPAALREYGR